MPHGQWFCQAQVSFPLNSDFHFSSLTWVIYLEKLSYEALNMFFFFEELLISIFAYAQCNINMDWDSSAIHCMIV